MRHFAPRELERFLVAVDRHLTTPQRVTIIGGSAAALAYGVSRATTDVDTYETDLAPLAVALERARDETGLAIPVTNTAVADAPYRYEDRLLRQLPQLDRLLVFVLEAHDLVLSKALRAQENDLAAIEELHRRHPLDERLLVDRYVTEMGHAIGDPRRLDSNFLLVVGRVFGEVAYDRTQRRLKRR